MTDPRKPHVHAALIKQWADGAEIEVLVIDKGWQPLPLPPKWNPTRQYRVKPTPHKWQKEMDAQEAGIPCQMRLPGTTRWFNGDFCFDSVDGDYRIKPEPVVMYGCAVTTAYDMAACIAGSALRPTRDSDSNLKLTFEDGKLVNAEVLK